MGIGDLAAHDGDHVGLAGGEDGFGVVGGSDMRLGCDFGVFDRAFQDFRHRGGKFFGEQEGGHQAFEIEIAAVAAGDVIDMACRIVQGHDFGEAFDRQGYLMRVRGGDGEADDEIIATGAADAFDDAAGKAGAVFQAAAPLIIAGVGPRGPELIEQGVVGGPNLYPLKARLVAADGGGDMGGDEFLDFTFRHAVGAVAVVIAGMSRRGPMRLEGQVGIAMRADVVKLLQDDRAFRAGGVCHLAEMGDDVVGAVQVIAPRQHAGAVDGDGFHHDHPGAALGAFSDVAKGAGAGKAHVGHVVGVRAKDDAVPERGAAQGDRAGEVGVLAGGHGRVLLGGSPQSSETGCRCVRGDGDVHSPIHAKDLPGKARFGLCGGGVCLVDHAFHLWHRETERFGVSEMGNALRRWIVKSHLRSMARAGRPVGAGMAIFLDDFIGEKILLDGGFDLEELRCLQTVVFPQVTKGGICLDIGANIGNHARVFARYFPQVHAFEPHPRIFSLLSANAYGQPITAHNFGLSDQAARLSVMENQENLGASRIVQTGVQTDMQTGGQIALEYEVRRLDDVVAAEGLGRVSFVKIDVEGHEAQVIRGGAAVLRRDRPIVTFEVLAETVVRGEPEAVRELRALGYEYFYRLVPQAAWKRMRPSVFSRLLRAFARLRGSADFEGLRIVPFESLGHGEDYAVLVAAGSPLGTGSPA